MYGSYTHWVAEIIGATVRAHNAAKSQKQHLCYVLPLGLHKGLDGDISAYPLYVFKL